MIDYTIYQKGNQMEYIPYTYLIGWSNRNAWYYGVEYGIKKHPCANPSNLWTVYFTSSSTVSFYRDLYGEPDVVSIRRVFNTGSSAERMERAIMWEKTVLSRINIVDAKWLNGRIGGDICPATVKKINMLRYGVENVFQSQEMQDRIKAINLKKYGVVHPSYSTELLAKKAANNIAKYGIACTLQLPDVSIKRAEALRRPEVTAHRKQTNIQRYGAVSPSQNSEIKAKVQATRARLLARPVVQLLKEYARINDIVLGSGWYQKSDDVLQEQLCLIQQQYGYYTIDELTHIPRSTKYSAGIKKLQERETVQSILKYKRVYGNRIRLGRGWDRKSDAAVLDLLTSLINEYGPI